MEAYLNHLREEGYSHLSIRGQQAEILRFTNWLQHNNSSIETLSYSQIMGYIRSMQQRKVAQSSIQKRVGHLKNYLNWLVKEGFIAHNPILTLSIQGVQKSRFYNIIEPEELEQLYEMYPEEKQIRSASGYYPSQKKNRLARKRNKIMLGLLIYQGIRIEELTQLQTTDINIKQGTIRIPGGRRHNERTLKLAPSQIYAMHEYITQVRNVIASEQKQQSELLFISVHTSKSVHGSVYSINKELKNLHPSIKNLEQIRASVISNWLKHYHIRKVQYMAGHRYVSSTEKYQQYHIEDLQQVINTHTPVPSIS